MCSSRATIAISTNEQSTYVHLARASQYSRRTTAVEKPQRKRSAEHIQPTTGSLQVLDMSERGPLLDSQPMSPRSTGYHDDPTFNTVRDKLKHFLISKWAHYLVIILVGLDVAGIFADFLITVHICEHTCGDRVIDNPKTIARWEDISDGLGIVSLVFSTIFMVELIFSIYAFGIDYFKSSFHIIDCGAIVASFLVDVIGRGQNAEAGSLIIALRFFRVFKIIEEGSVAAEEVGSDMQEHIKHLKHENAELRRRITATRDD